MTKLVGKTSSNRVSDSIELSITAAKLANTFNLNGLDEKLFEDILHEDNTKVVECIEKFCLVVGACWEEVPDNARCEEIDSLMRTGIHKLKEAASQIDEYNCSKKSIVILMIFLYAQLFMRSQVA